MIVNTPVKSHPQRVHNHLRTEEEGIDSDINFCDPFLFIYLAVLARPRCSLFLINVIAKSEFSQPFRLQFWWRHCDPAGPQEL